MFTQQNYLHISHLFPRYIVFQIYQLIPLVKKLIDYLFLKIQSRLFFRWNKLEGLLRLRKTQNALQLPVFFFLNSANLIRNIGEFHAKNYFTDHRTAKTIQLFVPIKRKLFGSILFQNNLFGAAHHETSQSHTFPKVDPKNAGVTSHTAWTQHFFTRNQ